MTARIDSISVTLSVWQPFEGHYTISLNYVPAPDDPFIDACLEKWRQVEAERDRQMAQADSTGLG